MTLQKNPPVPGTPKQHPSIAPLTVKGPQEGPKTMTLDAKGAQEGPKSQKLEVKGPQEGPKFMKLEPGAKPAPPAFMKMEKGPKPEAPKFMKLEKGAKPAGPQSMKLEKGAKPAGPQVMALDVKGPQKPPEKMTLQKNPTVPGSPKQHPAQMALVKNPPVPGSPKQHPSQMSLVKTGVHRRGDDHYGDYNWTLTIDGIDAGRFQKVDGISVEFDEIEYRDGMDPYPRKRMGMKKFGTIKLTKGYTGNTALWDWCKKLMDGSNDRRTGSLKLLDDDGTTEVVAYDFIDAWPKRWNGFRLDGKGNGAAVEEIEIVVEYVMKHQGLLGAIAGAVAGAAIGALTGSLTVAL